MPPKIHHIARKNYGIQKVSYPLMFNPAMLNQYMQSQAMMRSGMSGMQLVTLEDDLSAKPQVQPQGMQLVTLEGLNGPTGDEQKGMDLVKQLNSTSEVHHFSVLKDPKIIAGLCMNRQALILTDKVGNTIVVGYYDDEKRLSSEFNMMFDNGMFFNGRDAAAIKNSDYVWSHVRDIRDEWPIRTARQIVNNNNHWLQKMQSIEATGKRSSQPYIYRIIDEDTIGWDEALNIIVPVLGIVAVLLPGVGVAVAGAVVKIATMINNAVKNGTVDIFTLTNTVTEGLSLIGANDGFMKTISDNASSVQKYLDKNKDLYTKGVNVYNAIENKDYAQIAKTLMLEKESLLPELKKYINEQNIKKVADIVNQPLKEVEKIMQSVQNSDMVQTATLETRKLWDSAIARGQNALAIPAVQQFLTNATATVENYLKTTVDKADSLSVLAGYVPNSQALVRTIIDNNSDDINITEFKTLIDLAQGAELHPENLQKLTTTALIEKAKEATENNQIFVIPSNLSQSYQEKLMKVIPREVPKARVKTLHPAIKFYEEFV